MFRPTIIDLNPVKLKYNPFVINLDKCCGNCNVFSPNTCIPKKAKGKNNKAFNIITNKNEVKTMTNIFLVIANPNLVVEHVIQIKNGIIKHINVNVKINVNAQKIIAGILAHVFVRIASI